MHQTLQTHAWTYDQALELYQLPLFELIEKAHAVHKEFFPNMEVQASTLLSIKTGGCKEDCSYCPQSSKYQTGVAPQKLLQTEDVVEKAKIAKTSGATRFCMGAAWRSPSAKGIENVCEMIKQVKELGLQTCATLGMLEKDQAEKLKEAGLDFYNHNIDSSEEFYPKIISTRTFQDRLDTLDSARQAGLKLCCGGILGMGETHQDRIKMLITLTSLEHPPESIPINQLIPIPGTPLAQNQKIDAFDFVRTIALARILLPTSHVRLSAGRESMDDSLQALCFYAGANSIFFGDVLLTAKNPSMEKDLNLLQRLGLKLETV